MQLFNSLSTWIRAEKHESTASPSSPPPQKTPEDVRPQHHSRPFFSSLCPENRPSPPPEMSYRGPISLLTFCPFCPVSQVSIGGVIFAKLFFSPLFVFFLFQNPDKITDWFSSGGTVTA